MSEFHLEGAGSVSQRNHLVSQADTEDRQAPPKRADHLDDRLHVGRIAGTVREEKSVGTESHHLGRNIVGHYRHVATLLVELADDVVLDAAIDRHHVETMIGRAGEPTLAAAHALDHVAAHGRLLQAAQGLLLRHRRIDDDHPLGTLVTNNARQHTGIDPPDAGYAVLLAYFAKGLGIAEITRQVVVFAHDHTADSRILGS